MYRQVIEKAAEKMKKTTSVYQEDLRSIRAGRANPQFLERVTVDYYGVQTPLTQMGNITSPEPRMLVINVWDQKAIPMVEKAILKSDLGLNPTNDGKIIRLLFPEFMEIYEENCPAHVFDYNICGAGYPYHHCFRQKKLSLREYDTLWKGFLGMEHDEESGVRLAWWRLRCPAELTERAARRYWEEIKK